MCGNSNLADEPSLANGLPWDQIWQMNLLWLMDPQGPNLADEPSLANGPPWDQSRDPLNTSTQKLEDEPTLADGSPSTRAEMP